MWPTLYNSYAYHFTAFKNTAILQTHVKFDVSADVACKAWTIQSKYVFTSCVLYPELGLAYAPALLHVSNYFSRWGLYLHPLNQSNIALWPTKISIATVYLLCNNVSTLLVTIALLKKEVYNLMRSIKYLKPTALMLIHLHKSRKVYMELPSRKTNVCRSLLIKNQIAELWHFSARTKYLLTISCTRHKF